MVDKIMNMKIKLTTAHKLHALAEKNGETMVDTLERIVEQEWQKNITRKKIDTTNSKEQPCESLQ